MKEAFYEESAQPQKKTSQKRLYMTFQVFSYISIALAVIQAFVCFLMVPGFIGQYQEGAITGQGLAMSLIMWIGLVFVFALCAFIFFRLKRRFYVSYDYVFVEDELRISKVFNEKKRKFIVTLKADQIHKIGNWADEDGFSRTVSGLNGKKPKYMTPNREPSEEKYFIYMLTSTTLEKNVYVIECRMDMLEYLVRAVGRSKLEWKQ